MANQIHGYTVVGYPESMPDDCYNLLSALPSGFCSALHDQDVDEDGIIKKPHVHFFFQGRLTKKQKEYVHKAIGVSYGEDVRNASAMYDYLTHENNPDKYHYSKDIIKYSAKWCQELFDSIYEPPKAKMVDLINFIEINGITEYRDLLQAIADKDRMELMKLAREYWVIRYVDSKRNLQRGQ